MTDLMLLLVLALLLLLAAPQLLSYVVGSLAQRRGSWWPVLAAIVLAPAVFYLVATTLYTAEAASPLQGDAASGQILVSAANLQLGVAAHAGGALLIQIGRMIRSS